MRLVRKGSGPTDVEPHVSEFVGLQDSRSRLLGLLRGRSAQLLSSIAAGQEKLRQQIITEFSAIGFPEPSRIDHTKDPHKIQVEWHSPEGGVLLCRIAYQDGNLYVDFSIYKAPPSSGQSSRVIPLRNDRKMLLKDFTPDFIHSILRTSSNTPDPMGFLDKKIQVTVPHSLSIDEVKNRGEKLINKVLAEYGSRVSNVDRGAWSGNTRSFSFSTPIGDVKGTITISGASITLDETLGGALRIQEGLIVSTIRAKAIELLRNTPAALPERMPPQIPIVLKPRSGPYPTPPTTVVSAPAQLPIEADDDEADVLEADEVVDDVSNNAEDDVPEEDEEADDEVDALASKLADILTGAGLTLFAGHDISYDDASNSYFANIVAPGITNTKLEFEFIFNAAGDPIVERCDAWYIRGEDNYDAATDITTEESEALKALCGKEAADLNPAAIRDLIALFDSRHLDAERRTPLPQGPGLQLPAAVAGGMEPPKNPPEDISTTPEAIRQYITDRLSQLGLDIEDATILIRPDGSVQVPLSHPDYFGDITVIMRPTSTGQFRITEVTLKEDIEPAVRKVVEDALLNKII